jgi:hypothetical protein
MVPTYYRVRDSTESRKSWNFASQFWWVTTDCYARRLRTAHQDRPVVQLTARYCVVLLVPQAYAGGP